MLDIKFIRENKEIIRNAAEKKHIDFDVNELISIDNRRLEIIKEVEGMRKKQNTGNEDLKNTKDKKKKDKIISDMKILKNNLQQREKDLKMVMEEWYPLMLLVPNIPDVSVPDGDSDEHNKEIRVSDGLKKFTWEPRDHIKIMKEKDMVDFEKGVKVSGFRGYILKNSGAKLSFALWQYTIDFFKNKGYELAIVPSLINKEGLLGTGYLPTGEEDLYKTQDDKYLSGTAEVSTMAQFMDTIFSEKELPKKILSFSPCFRREAGSYGKDTKGLMRVHEFFKLEQVVLCTASHEESVRLHEEITKNAEDLVSSLGIPYRVVLNCGGDLGLGQVKKYDIEVFVPSENKYKETHSSSYFHDFQSRRLNIRYKDKEGKNKLVHSLNNTAIATPRILIAIVENFQNEDGSISVPEKLVPYFGEKLIS